VIEPLSFIPLAVWQLSQSNSAGALATIGAPVLEAGDPEVLAYAMAAQAMNATTAARRYQRRFT
jgi:hypothetical protein